MKEPIFTQAEVLEVLKNSSNPEACLLIRAFYVHFTGALPLTDAPKDTGMTLRGMTTGSPDHAMLARFYQAYKSERKVAARRLKLLSSWVDFSCDQLEWGDGVNRAELLNNLNASAAYPDTKDFKTFKAGFDAGMSHAFPSIRNEAAAYAESDKESASD